MQDPIQNILQEKKNTFVQLLKSFGLSGIAGGAASLITGRVTSSAASSVFGGSIGIGVGVVVGVGTFAVQARSHFKGNRELINSLYEEMNKNISETLDTVEEYINEQKEKINESMVKDIQEINAIIDIIIDRVIKLFSEK